MEKIACSWSGGKDSCFALMEMMKHDQALAVLVNMMNESGKISRSHGIPLSILKQQAGSMDIPLVAIPTSWQDYEMNFISTLKQIKNQYAVDTMVFGDIDLQAHRDWEEKVCRTAGVVASLPLWKRDREQLVYEMMNAGIETMIVSCNTVLGEEFLGRLLDESLIPELQSKGVDVCGENGEFHTLVVNCPLFKSRIDLPVYEKITHEDYCFLQFPSF